MLSHHEILLRYPICYAPFFRPQFKPAALAAFALGIDSAAPVSEIPLATVARFMLHALTLLPGINRPGSVCRLLKNTVTYKQRRIVVPTHRLSRILDGFEFFVVFSIKLKIVFEQILDCDARCLFYTWKKLIAPGNP